MSSTLIDYPSLSEVARKDLAARVTDTTLLKYLQGQAKEYINSQLGQDPGIAKVYAKNNYVILNHILTQIQSNIEFKKTKEVPIKEIGEIAKLIAQFPGSIGFEQLSQKKQDYLFVQMFKLILKILQPNELNIQSRCEMYSALFLMASTHTSYLSRHKKVDRIIKEKIQKLHFSENEIEKKIGLIWFK